MYSRFAELETSETTLMRSTAVEIRQLLELVDEILKAEAYTNDEEIPNLSDSPTTISCAFCGGEVFQKVFRCRNKCPKEGTDPTLTGTIVICPSCYIDGRTCLCGKMAPFRLRPIAQMVAFRNEVAAWLRSCGKDLLLSDDSEDDTDANLREIVELSVFFSSRSCSRD